MTELVTLWRDPTSLRVPSRVLKIGFRIVFYFSCMYIC